MKGNCPQTDAACPLQTALDVSVWETAATSMGLAMLFASALVASTARRRANNKKVYDVFYVAVFIYVRTTFFESSMSELKFRNFVVVY